MVIHRIVYDESRNENQEVVNGTRMYITNTCIHFKKNIVVTVLHCSFDLVFI